MELKLKEIKTREELEALILPYYDFFEQLYGKYFTTGIVRGRILQGKNIPKFLYTFDDNYRLAQDAVSQENGKKGVHMMGVFDEKDILTAIGRMREVTVDNTQYTCVSEIIPTVETSTSFLLEIIRAFEKYEMEHGTSDVLSFEAPVVDKDLQLILDIYGYSCEFPKFLGYTLMYDKPLNRNRSIN